jgi:hypothetical protein
MQVICQDLVTPRIEESRQQFSVISRIDGIAIERRMQSSAKPGRCGGIVQYFLDARQVAARLLTHSSPAKLTLWHVRHPRQQTAAVGANAGIRRSTLLQ